MTQTLQIFLFGFLRRRSREACTIEGAEMIVGGVNDVEEGRIDFLSFIFCNGS